MAQITKKFIGDNQVADEKIRLDNNGSLKSRNAANSADVDLLKLNGTDTLILQNGVGPVNVQLTGSSAYIGDTSYISVDDTGETVDLFANNGVGVLLDGQDFTIRGNAFGDPNFKINRSDDTFGVRIKAPAALAADYTLTLPADDGASGEVLSTNGSGVLSWVASGGGATWAKETFTLVAGDITAQKVTVANTPIAASVIFTVKGGPSLFSGGASPDYSVTGADVNFLNDLATGGAAALVAGDIVQVQYQY
jgi:hypothetical protein